MIHLEMVNHDQMFNHLKYSPIVVNDLDVSSDDEKGYLNDMLLTRYEGDTLDVMPSCECGRVRGQYNAGIRCESCFTVCSTVTEKPLEAMVWIRAPDGIDTLISPHAWIIMSRMMSVTGLDGLQWMTSALYQPPSDRAQEEARRLENAGFKRGLNNFYRNFDSIMDAYITGTFMKKPTAVRHKFHCWVKENRRHIFAKHIPIPSRLGFIIESTNSGVFADANIGLALDAVRSITSLKRSLSKLPKSRVEQRAVRSVSQLAAYYSDFYRGAMSKKKGWCRQHIFGSRLHFTGRAVISSITTAHHIKELHVPWGMAVQILKLHIANKLLRRNISSDHINMLFYKYANRYHPLLDEVIQELIDESPHMGVPCIFQRNPSLVRGSAQYFFITKVKKDPRIYSVSMSPLVLKAPNADFDGDELNMLLILDANTGKALSRLDPDFGALDIKEPRRVSANLTIPPPVISTIDNWLRDGQF